MTTTHYEPALQLNTVLAKPITIDADIVQTITTALDNGWTIDTLAANVNRGLPDDASTGLVVYRIIKAAQRPAPGKDRRRSTSSVPLAIRRHTFDQDPDNEPGWCRCHLPASSRHHH